MNIEDAGGSLRGSAIVCSIQRRELGAAAIMADNTQPKTQTAAAAAAAEQQPQSGVLGPDAVSATPTEVLAAAASAIATDDATGWAPATSHSGMDVAILASPTLNAPSLEPSGPYARYSASGRTPHSRPSRVTLSLVAPGADRYDVLAAEAACVYAVRMRRLRGRAPATAVRHSALTAPGAVPPGAAGANAGPGADAGISGRSASGAASGSSTIGAAWGRGAEHAAVPTSAAGPASSCYGGTSSGPFPELEISPRSDPAPALSGAQLAALSSLFQPHSCAARGGVTGGNDNGNVRGGDGSSRGPGLAPGHGGRRASQVATSSGAMPTLPEGVEVGTMRPQALGLQGEAAEGEEDEHCQAAHLQGQRQHAAASAAPAPQVLLPAQMAEGGGASSFATSLAVIAVDSCTRGFGPPSDGDALAAGPGSAALSDTFSAYAAGLSEALSLLPGPNSGGRDAAGRGSRRRRSMWVQRRSTGSCSGSGTAASSLQGLHEFSGEVEGPSGHLQAAAAAAGASSYSHSSSARRSAAGILHSVVAPGLPGRPALKRSSMPSASALALAATLGRALKEEADGDSTGDRRSSTGDGVVGFSRMVRQDSPVTPRAIQARGFQACEVVSAAAAATAGAMGAVAAAGGATAGVPGAGAAAAHCRVQQLLRPAAGSAEGTSGHSLSLSAIAPGPGGDRRSFDSATGSVVTAAGMCLRPSLDAGPAQRDDGAAVEAAIAAGAGTAAAIPAADEVADTNSYDSYDTEEDDTEPGGAVGKGGASGADAAGSQGFTKSAAGGIAGPKDAAAGGRGAAAAAASHAATAAVDRYGSLLVGSAGWRYTEMHDVHDTLLMSRLTSNSRWRGPQALGSVASGHNANRSEGGAEVHSTRGGSNSKWLSPAGPSAPLGAALGQPHHSYQQVNHTSRQRRPAAMVDSHASHEVDLGLVDLAPLSSAQHSPGLSPNPSITSYRLHQLLQPGVEMSPTGTAPTSANTDAIIALATGPGGGDAAAPAGPADAAAEAWAAWYRAVPSTRHTTSTQHYILEPPHTLSPRTSLGSGGMAPSPAATAALPTNTVPGAGSGARPNSDAGGTSPAPPASGIVVPAASRPAANQGRASLDSRLATPGHSHYRTAAGAGGPTGFSFGAWSQARPPPHHPRPTTGTWLGGGHVAGSNTWRPPAAGGGMVAAAAAGGRPGSGNRSRMAASTLGPGQAPAAVSVPQQPHQRQHDHTHGYPPPHPLHPDPQGQQGQHQLPTSASALNSAHGGGRAMALVSPVRGAPGFRVSRTSMASPTAARMSAGGSNHGHDYRPLGGEAPSGGVTGDSDVNLLMTTGEFMAGVAVSAEQEHPQLDEQQQPALQQAMGWAATLEVLREQVTCPSPPVPSPRVSVAGRSSRMLSAGFKLLAGGRSQRSFKGMHGAGDVGDGVTGYAPGSERTTPVPSPLVHAAARGQHRSSAGGGGPAGASRVLAVVTGAPPGSRSRAVSAAGAMPLAASSPVISSGSEAAAGTAPAAAPSPRAQPAAERPSRMRTSTHGAGAAPASPLPAASSSAEPSRTSLPAGVAAGGGGGAGAGSPRPSLFTRTLKALLPGPRSVPQSPRAQSLPSDEVGHAEDAEPGSDAAVDADPGMGRPFTLFQAPPLHAGATPAVAAAPHAPSLPHRPASRTLSRLALGRACSGAGDPNSTAEPPARPLHDSDTGGRDWTPGPAGQSVPPSAAHAGPAATHGGSIGGRSRGADSFTFGVPRPPPPPMGRWSMDDGWQRVRSPDAVMAVGDAAATAPPLAHRRLQRPYHFYSDGHVNLLSAHDASVPRGAVAVAPVDQPTAVMPAPTAALAMAAGRAVRLLPTLLCEVREEDSESAGDPASSRRGTDVGLLGDAVGSSSGAAGLAAAGSARALGAAGCSADGGGGGNGDSAAGDSGDGSAQHPQQPARSRLAKLFGLKRSASGGGAGSTGVVSTGSWTGLSGVGSVDEGLASAPASPSGGGRGGLVRALTRSRLASLAAGGGPGQQGRPDSQPSSAGDSAAAALAADSSAAAPAGASLGAGQRSASGLKTFMHSLWSSKAATQRKSSKRAAAGAAAGLDVALGAGPSATHAPGVGGGAAVPGDTTDRSCHSASSAHSPLSALSEGKHSQGHAALAATSRLREAAWADLEPQALAPSLRSLPVATSAASASVPGSPLGSGANQGSSRRRKLHKKLLRLGQRLTGGGGGSSSSGGDGGSGQGTGPEGSPRGGGRGAATGTAATPMARRVKSLFMPPSHSHFAAPDAAPDAASNTTPSGYAAPAPAPASGYPHGSGMQVATASANAAAAHSTSHSRVRAQALAHAHAQAQAEAQARMNQLAPLAAALFTPGK